MFRVCSNKIYNRVISYPDLTLFFGRGRSGYEINNRVMLSGEGNGIDLITEKATLHVQHTFFVHFFAVVLHDYNVKLPETS